MNQTTDRKPEVRAVTLFSGLTIIGFDKAVDPLGERVVLLQPLFASVDTENGYVNLAEISPLSVEALESVTLAKGDILAGPYEVDGPMIRVYEQALSRRDDSRTTRGQQESSGNDDSASDSAFVKA